MKQPAAPAPYYPALTGLRALAALAVFCFHQRPGGLGELHIGVSVFFTLSGYLITRRYAGQRFGPGAWVRYLAHRVARIMPVYGVLLTAVFIGRLVKYQPPLWALLRSYLLHLTLAMGLVQRWALDGISQAWSLTVEEGFYVLAPGVFWLGWRYGPRRAWPGLALAMVATGLAVYHFLPVLGSPSFVLRVTIFGRLSEFLIGAAFAWHPPRRHRWATGGGALGLAAGLGLLVAVQRATHHISIDTYPGLAVNNLLLPLATGWLLHGLAHERTAASRLLGSPTGQLLGRASYCFYLIHMGPLANWLTGLLLPGLPAAVPRALALLALLTLASLALYAGLERPAHRWLLAWFGRWKLAPAREMRAPLAAG
jgi:peptidoglycan/LPS O-acetylase OafA/YrhL